MEGSTRVRMDFDQNKPYLEVRVSKSSEDARDELISAFMEKGQHGQLRPWFTYVGRDEVKDLDYWRLDWIDPTESPTELLEMIFPGRLIWVLPNDADPDIYSNWRIVIFQGWSDEGGIKCNHLGRLGSTETYKRWRMVEPNV